jgi:hypothetical protein
MDIFPMDLDDDLGKPQSVRSSASSMDSATESVIAVAVPIDIKRLHAAAKGRVARPMTI